MSNLSTYTSVFRANSGYRTKRNRQPVSCTACQRRKTRCDRQQPCDACCQRGDPSRCLFGSTAGAGASAGSSNGSGVGAAAVGGRKEVQSRLARLEEIVKELASSDEGRSTTKKGSRGAEAVSAEDGASGGSGDGELEKGLQVDLAEGQYHGATSWASLVDNIRDIQHILNDGEAKDVNRGSAVDELFHADMAQSIPECFLAHTSTIELSEIMTSLPPRQETDKLLAIFFNAKFVALPFIHMHQFRRQYEAFWEGPSSANYLWVSILFSILSMAATVVSVSPSRHSFQKASLDDQEYRILAARCFMAGEYYRGKPLSVEALLMHVHSRNNSRDSRDDADPFVWSFYGLALRIAQRQGYHREMTKVSARATPFAAEMRRRSWFMLRAMDIMHSSQQGMPPMVDESLCDTADPTNLTDDDFDEDTVMLPPARSSVDATSILAYVTKAPLCTILGRVLRHALATEPRPYSDVLALHAELEAWKSSVPACLRVRPIKDSAFTDPGYTIMHRIMLEVMYRKTLCILHREYLSAQARSDPQYATSRIACRDAAVRLLEMHIELNEEIKPGGRMHEERYMLNSMTLHDFLVAAMILCTDLNEVDSGNPSPHRQQHVDILRQVADIWASRCDVSSDARRATRILKAILRKVDSSPSSAATSQLPTPQDTITRQMGNMDTSPNHHAHEWHMSLDDNSFGFDPFGGNAGFLDWFVIDEYLRSGNSQDAQWASAESSS